MLIKSLTFKNFDGVEETRDFYFNLSKGEVIEMELSENLQGGLSNKLKRVIEANDGSEIIETFRSIISKAYGVKGSDGVSFVKTKELSAGFLGSEAYSALLMELLSKPEAAADFIRSVLPSDIELDENGIKQPQDFKPSAREQFQQAKKEPTTPVYEDPRDAELRELRARLADSQGTEKGEERSVLRREDV